MQAAIRRPIAALVAASMLALSLPAPAQTGDAPAAAARERVERLLVQNGVEAREARERVAALTDEEAIRAAVQFDKLPAGGNPGLVLLSTLFVYGIAFIVAIPIILIGALVEAALDSASGGAVAVEAEARPGDWSPEPRY